MNEGIKVLILLEDLNRLKDQLEGCREMIEYQKKELKFKSYPVASMVTEDGSIICPKCGNYFK